MVNFEAKATIANYLSTLNEDADIQMVDLGRENFIRTKPLWECNLHLQTSDNF